MKPLACFMRKEPRLALFRGNTGRGLEEGLLTKAKNTPCPLSKKKRAPSVPFFPPYFWQATFQSLPLCWQFGIGGLDFSQALRLKHLQCSS